MTDNSYTKEEAIALNELVHRIFKEVPKLKEYFENELDMWSDNPPLSFAELHALKSLTVDNLVIGNDDLVHHILNIIEKFLDSADAELRAVITYFFFEDLTNSISHKDKVYTKKLVSILGPHSKECCRYLDKIYRTETSGLYEEK